MPSDPLSRPLIEIARELRDRRTTARELVDAAIARHESVGERLHAYSFWAPEQARAVANAAAAAFAAGRRRLDPAKQGYPSAANRSFSDTGNPWRGPAETPAANAASAAAATARACSGAQNE